MLKKIGLLFCVLASLVVLSSGCETTKGIARGFANGVVAAVDNTSEGVSRDAAGAWKAISGADKWMTKNLW